MQLLPNKEIYFGLGEIIKNLKFLEVQTLQSIISHKSSFQSTCLPKKPRTEKQAWTSVNKYLIYKIMNVFIS